MGEPVYMRAIETRDADIGDELVAMDVDAGTTFGFNSVAASVWRILSTPRSFEALRDELLDQYDVSAEECSTDLRRLLAEMIADGLIREAP